MTLLSTSRTVPLLNEASILAYPSLARLLGINEAIVIQQIYFYISLHSQKNSQRHFHEGHWWVYNSYEQWCDQHFPWLATRTLQRIMLRLEMAGIILSLQGVENRYDRRKWYSLDLNVLHNLIKNATMHRDKMAPSKDSGCDDDSTETPQRQKQDDSPAEIFVSISDQAANADSRGQDHEKNRILHQKPTVSVEDTTASPTTCGQSGSLPMPAAPDQPVGARHAAPVVLAQGQGLACQTPTPRPMEDRVGATHGSPSVSRTPHSHKPAINPMQAAVIHAFKVPAGSFAGKIGQFFAGKIPRRKDRWGQYQPDTPASPQEVLGLLIWYRQHPAYAQSFIEHGRKLPSTPAILGERLAEFRESPTYAQIMQQAQPVLERLLRGEAVPTVTAVSQAAANPIESAAAYTAYNPARDPAAQRRETDAEAVAMFEKLFGDDQGQKLFAQEIKS